MIDLILLAFTLLVWYFGFWLGAKYMTLPALWASVKSALTGWLGRS